MQSNDGQGARSLRRPLPINLRNAAVEPPVFTSSTTNDNNSRGGGASSSLTSLPSGNSPSMLSMRQVESTTPGGNSHELKKQSLAELLAAKHSSPSSTAQSSAGSFFPATSSQKNGLAIGNSPSVISPPLETPVKQSSATSSRPVLTSHHVDPLSKQLEKESAPNEANTNRYLSDHTTSHSISTVEPKTDSTARGANNPVFTPSSAPVQHSTSLSNVSESKTAPNPTPPSRSPPITHAVVSAAPPSDLLLKKQSGGETSSFSFAPRSSPAKKEEFMGATGSLSPFSPSKGTIFASGMKGAVRQRLLKEMIDHIEDTYKVIICDQLGAQILNSCFRMHELMEHDVVVVEDLMMARQPVLNSPALYFLSPENPLGIKAMEADWSARPRYKNLHVFWTSQVSDEVLEQLSRNRLLAEHLQSMVDMMLDFEAAETLLFHLDTNLDFSALVSTSFAASQTNTSEVESKTNTQSGSRLMREIYSEAQWHAVERHQKILEVLTRKLLCALHTIGEGMPIIRYHSQSPTAKQFAEMLISEAEKLVGAALSPTALHRPQLIIVDRCCDLLEPLAHHRSYQCLAAELCPFPNGVYEQTYQGRKGEELKRVMMIDEQDEYWGRYRHESFDVCLSVFQEDLRKLLEEHPSLAHGMQKGVSVAAAGSAIRALPEFLERQSKLSAHVDICTGITQRYAKQQLQAVVDMELDIIYHRRPPKELLKEIKIIGGDLTISAPLRVRLLLFSFVFLSEKVFPAKMRQQLITNCGLANQMLPMMEGLHLAQQRLSRSCFSTLTKNISFTIKESSPSTEELTDARKQTTGSVGSPPSKGLLHHPTFAKLILEGILKESLDPLEFPYATATEDNREGGLRSLREHLSLKKEKKQTLRYNSLRNATRHDAREKEESLLHLGYEGTYCLRAPEKVILFVLGGVTYGEGRVAYEVAKEYGREVIVGGSHILQPTDFLKEMRECGEFLRTSPSQSVSVSVEKGSFGKTSSNVSMDASVTSVTPPLASPMEA